MHLLQTYLDKKFSAVERYFVSVLDLSDLTLPCHSPESESPFSLFLSFASNKVFMLSFPVKHILLSFEPHDLVQALLFLSPCLKGKKFERIEHRAHAGPVKTLRRRENDIRHRGFE